MLGRRARAGGPRGRGSALTRPLGRRVFVLPALLALATLAACGRDAAPEVNAATLLERAAARLERASTYHFVVEFEGGAATIARGLTMRRAEGTFAGAKNLDSTVLASFGPIDARVGIRVVNGESWITNPLTGKWEAEPISVAQLFDVGSGVTALMRGAVAPRVAGEEAIGGATTRRIEGTLSSDEFRLVPGVPPGSQLRATAWVGVEDDLVRRLEVRGPIFSATPTTEGVVRVTFSRFDEPFAIGPPP